MDNPAAIEKAKEVLEYLKTIPGYGAIWSDMTPETRAVVVHEMAAVLMRTTDKPVGQATIVQEAPIEQFPAHDENTTS